MASFTARERGRGGPGVRQDGRDPLGLDDAEHRRAAPRVGAGSLATPGLAGAMHPPEVGVADEAEVPHQVVQLVGAGTLVEEEQQLHGVASSRRRRISSQ